MLQPQFADKVFTISQKNKVELFSVAAVKNLGKDYIQVKLKFYSLQNDRLIKFDIFIISFILQSEVLIHVRVSNVEETIKWFYHDCTACHNEAELQDVNIFCSKCNRVLPHPDQKYDSHILTETSTFSFPWIYNGKVMYRFKIKVIASDQTGDIEIVLGDRQVRMLIGKRARQVIHEVCTTLTLMKSIIYIITTCSNVVTGYW